MQVNLYVKGSQKSLHLCLILFDCGGKKCNRVEERIDVSFCRGQSSLREQTKKETKENGQMGEGDGEAVVTQHVQCSLL